MMKQQGPSVMDLRKAPVSNANNERKSQPSDYKIHWSQSSLFEEAAVARQQKQVFHTKSNDRSYTSLSSSVSSSSNHSCNSDLKNTASIFRPASGRINTNGSCCTTLSSSTSYDMSLSSSSSSAGELTTKLHRLKRRLFLEAVGLSHDSSDSNLDQNQHRSGDRDQTRFHRNHSESFSYPE